MLYLVTIVDNRTYQIEVEAEPKSDAWKCVEGHSMSEFTDVKDIYSSWYVEKIEEKK